MSKFTTVVLLILAIGSMLFVPMLAYATSSSKGGLGDESAGKVVDALKDFATSNWGKALFFASLLGGVICILSSKYRAFGLVALTFGILLGAYGGLGEAIWELISGMSK